MFDLIRTYQLDIMLALSAACMTFGLLLFVTRFLEKRRKRILIFMEFVATFLLFFDRLAYIYSGDTSQTGYILVRVSNFFVYTLTAGIIFGFNMFLSDLLWVEGKVKRLPKRLILVGVSALVEIGLVIISQFTGLYYYFDEMNHYHRGHGFLFSYFIPVLGPLIQYTVIRQYKKSFSRLIYTSLVLYIFVPIAMGILQIFNYGVSIVNMAMVLVSILLYVFTYLDINETVVAAHQNEMVELKKEQKSIKRLFDQTATAFMAAVEKKYDYMEGHAKRVAELSRIVAKRLGKSEEECDRVYYAALLHDIGMIGVPDNILKKEELSEEEYEVVKQKPKIGSEILSHITEYPYLQVGARYSRERYDGKGYPEGISGKEIPDIARIISVCDAYVTMTHKKRFRASLPYQTVREEFIKQSGLQFDPDVVKCMISIMDEENGATEKCELVQVEKEIICKEYKEHVSVGIPMSTRVTKIEFHADLFGEAEGKFAAPSILLFDSYDRHWHDNEKTMEAYHYLEYGEIWFDGHFVSSEARNMEVEFYEKEDMEDDLLYVITEARYEDHLSIKMESAKGVVDAVVALPDQSKSSFIGLTGENCKLEDIKVTQPGESVGEGDIRKIADKVSYIDRMESDVKNVQVDRTRSAATEGIRIEEELQLDFHGMSLPSSSLVWHCPYILLFYSEDGRVNGKGYREYALIKVNGEVSSDKELSDNKFSMKKKEDFPGWETWKEKNKEGMEYRVFFEKKGNKISLATKNLGIEIEDTLVLKDSAKEVYVALTGDQVALTDIRIKQ
ncbi:MAG: HD domain-containing protein [Lachnospiraceae bacterium]|nr:HD domain-containing protein [Lachnospiraceae bacterium]